ncbi:MAG: phage/plasmid primase, P4 family [Bacteroidota bacterium]|jgi:putative DNA primase/helicase
MQISPVFDDLNNPSTFLNHLEGLKNITDTTPHKAVLHQLIEQVKVLDFVALANPKGADNFKLNNKHYLILSIENVLELAKKNSWGLCKNHDFIYLYNGQYWNELDRDNLQMFLGEAAEKMGVPVFEARYCDFREKLFKQFLSTAHLSKPESEGSTVLVNLKNGTYEIGQQGNRLRPFDRSDFLTYQLNFDYNPKSEAPLFQKYLDRVLPDKELQKVLAEYLGYVFTKTSDLKLEKVLLLYGGGANGKSVFFEIVKALLGEENMSNYSLHSLSTSDYHRAMLPNKLVNYASEINGKLETDIFKKMASGEPYEARLPYGKPFLVTNGAKLIFNSNELPKDIEHSTAFFRRFLIVPFEVTIPEGEQDKTLHKKIIEKELSGIFNWVLKIGLEPLLKQKNFTQSQKIQQAVEQFRIESDTVQQFLIENHYTPSTSEGHYEFLKDLFKSYQAYCNEGGYRWLNLKNFASRLRACNYETKRMNNGTVVYAQKK